MTTMQLPDDRIRIDGVVALETETGRVVPHRLDPSFAHQFPVETAFVEGMASGARMVFDTDASTIDVVCTPMRLTAGATRFPATFDLMIDGELVDRVEADFGHMVVLGFDGGDADFQSGERGTITLRRPSAVPATVEIWLPQSAGIELHAIGVPDGARVEASPTDRRPRWVHYGSSISHCMEAEGPSRTWPAVAADLTARQLLNLGLAGQCHIDQFVARTIRDAEADRISLKLGINVINGDTMTERTFASAVHGFLDTVREGHPDTPILVVSPIICPSAESVPGPTLLAEDGTFEAKGSVADLALGRLHVRRIRELLAGIVEKRTVAGDEHLSYLDGLTLFGEADVADLPDGLHPNAAGYVRMGERFAAQEFLTGGTAR